MSGFRIWELTLKYTVRIKQFSDKCKDQPVKINQPMVDKHILLF